MDFPPKKGNRNNTMLILNKDRKKLSMSLGLNPKISIMFLLQILNHQRFEKMKL